MNHKEIDALSDDDLSGNVASIILMWGEPAVSDGIRTWTVNGTSRGFYPISDWSEAMMVVSLLRTKGFEFQMTDQQVPLGPVVKCEIGFWSPQPKIRFDSVECVIGDEKRAILRAALMAVQN
jgi:hypothetical protein